jgi:crossover junction endodeoxyribonuclease RuvC
VIYIGIDPGAKGGFSQIRTYPNGQIDVMSFAWDNDGFVDFMRDTPIDFEPVKCAVEKVGAMPGNGSVSMFNFGRSYGFILGVLAALNIPYQVVPPREWKKEFGLNSDKAKSIEVCHRLFPNVDLKRTERCKTDSDGKAESVLIAEWCRRKM